MRDERHDGNAEEARDQPAGKPYLSWDEMMARIWGERADARVSGAEGSARPEWHDLVADMIVGR